jgi:hypothetical protein
MGSLMRRAWPALLLASLLATLLATSAGPARDDPPLLCMAEMVSNIENRCAAGGTAISAPPLQNRCRSFWWR